jgi:hypothetical protein
MNVCNLTTSARMKCFVQRTVNCYPILDSQLTPRAVSQWSTDVVQRLRLWALLVTSHHALSKVFTLVAADWYDCSNKTGTAQVYQGRYIQVSQWLGGSGWVICEVNGWRASDHVAQYRWRHNRSLLGDLECYCSHLTACWDYSQFITALNTCCFILPDTKQTRWGAIINVSDGSRGTQ